MEDFARRVEQRETILEKLHEPRLWFWTPAFSIVLDWLRERLDPGATVLELGCGLGFFLHALRDEGFEAVGLDVAETAVAVNRKDGFRVWHGPIETMPRGWVDPDAVVSFFMLHHLEDPLSFLTSVRACAPRAMLAVAVYGPSNTTDKVGSAAMPPRTLIRWNRPALGQALEQTGYGSIVYDLESSGSDLPVFALLRRALGHTMVAPGLYRLGKWFESAALARIPRRMKRDAYVVLAFAEPTLSEPD
jgi:SAM-dependent methyltransferase